MESNFLIKTPLNPKMCEISCDYLKEDRIVQFVLTSKLTGAGTVVDCPQFIAYEFAKTMFPQSTLILAGNGVSEIESIEDFFELTSEKALYEIGLELFKNASPHPYSLEIFLDLNERERVEHFFWVAGNCDYNVIPAYLFMIADSIYNKRNVPACFPEVLKPTVEYLETYTRPSDISFIDLYYSDQSIKYATNADEYYQEIPIERWELLEMLGYEIDKEFVCSENDGIVYRGKVYEYIQDVEFALVDLAKVVNKMAFLS